MRYVIAVLAAVFATLVRLAFTPLIGETAVPFITFVLAVLFVAWRCGFWPSALCALLSAMAGVYFFIPPVRSFGIPGQADWIRLLLFLLVGFVMALLGNSLRKQVGFRERLEAAEREHRQWLETTLASIGDAVVVADTSGKVVSMNAAALSLIRRAEGDVKGRPLEELLVVTGDSANVSAENALTQARREGRIVRSNGMQLTSNGRTIPVDVTASPMLDGAGRTIGEVVVFRDVSARVESEHGLARLRKELELELAATRSLHELSSRLLLHHDLNSLLEEVLRAAERVTGADMGKLQILDPNGDYGIRIQHGLTNEFVDYFDIHREKSLCAMALMRGGRVIAPDVEQSTFLADPPTLDVLRRAGVRALQSTPIIHRSGRSVGILSTHYREPRAPSERDLRLLDLLARQAADLIERLAAEGAIKKSEEALKASERQLALVTENMAAAVTRCSRDFRYLWVSRGYASWLGRPLDEIAGRPIRDVLGPDAYEEIRPYMERVLTGERVEYTTELNYFGRDRRWIHATYVPAYSDGTVDGWIAVISDLTETMNYQQQLRQANASLVRANEDLERFAFVASHDLQEPLRMITIYSELLRGDYGNGSAVNAATCIENIVAGTRRMRELLADLLTYTRVGQAAEAITEAVDLNGVLEDVKRDLRARIADHGATITADRLPWLAIHPGHFRSLLQNLIDNAIKYKSDQPPRIHISVSEGAGGYQFAVADNGIGIDPQYQAQVFEIFKRLHGSRIPGTGVGLAICKRVVERYGGRIWVESAEGHGATFFFSIGAPAACAAGSGER